jgi:hypothetical protein
MERGPRFWALISGGTLHEQVLPVQQRSGSGEALAWQEARAQTATVPDFGFN